MFATCIAPLAPPTHSIVKYVDVVIVASVNGFVPTEALTVVQLPVPNAPPFILVVNVVPLLSIQILYQVLAEM